MRANKAKRISSMLLVLVMIFSLLPSLVFAQEPENEIPDDEETTVSTQSAEPESKADDEDDDQDTDTEDPDLNKGNGNGVVEEAGGDDKETGEEEEAGKEEKEEDGKEKEAGKEEKEEDGKEEETDKEEKETEETIISASYTFREMDIPVPLSEVFIAAGLEYVSADTVAADPDGVIEILDDSGDRGIVLIPHAYFDKVILTVNGEYKFTLSFPEPTTDAGTEEQQDEGEEQQIEEDEEEKPANAAPVAEEEQKKADTKTETQEKYRYDMSGADSVAVADILKALGVEFKGYTISTDKTELIAIDGDLITAKVFFDNTVLNLSDGERTVVIQMSNTEPEAEDKTEVTGLSYTFGGESQTTVAEILNANGIRANLKNFRIYAADPQLVSVEKESKSFLRAIFTQTDYLIIPLKNFEETTVTVESISGKEGSYSIVLRNPAEPQTETLSAEQISVGYADVSKAAATLGLSNTDAVEIPVAAKAAKAAKAATREMSAPHYTKSGYVGLEISPRDELPAGNVSYLVSVTLPQPLDMTGLKNPVIDSLTVSAYHIADGEVRPVTVSAYTADNGVLTGLSFVTDGFSPYIVSYTVEFHNGDSEFVIDGGTQVLLSRLITELGLTRADGSSFTVDEVKKVEFKTPEVFLVEEVAGNGLAIVLNEGTEQEETVTIATGHDFVLTSRQPFTADQMILTFTDGTTSEIDVTDTQESSDLVDFLTNVVITGATQNPDSSYTVEADKEYTLTLTFSESSLYQFDNNAELTYTMPRGVRILTPQSGSLPVNVIYRGQTYQIDGGYTLDTNGNLKIKFDQYDPDFPKLEDATNVSFRFGIAGAFDNTTTHIQFSSSITRDVVFEGERPGEAFAEKTAVYDEETGVFRYTITVTASGGNVQDVNVKDTISGDALVFNDDVNVSVDSSRYTDNHATNGFDYTFASMTDDEVITITYSAHVDFSEVNNHNGIITADQTKNTVTVKPKDGDPHTSEYSHEISYKSTKKSNGSDAGTTEDGDKILSWTITYNELRLAAAAGDTVKDTIITPEYMKYYGDGITVKVYDTAGTLVDTRLVSYSSLTEHSDSTWTYTIPATDTVPYMYEITYQTVVDQDKVEGGGTTVTVSNVANGSGGSANVSPADEVSITKAVESQSTREVTWISTIHVPENGLTTAVVTDYVPRSWEIHESGAVYDYYKDGSLVVEGLLEGESYVVNVDAIGTVVTITFYKDANHDPGLQGTTGGHTVTIKLTTLVDQDWLEAGYNSTEADAHKKNHINTIGINGITTTAKAVFGKPGIEKTGAKYSGYDGAEYTGIMYSVILSGDVEPPVSVADTFDTNILQLDPNYEIYIYGGDQNWQGFKKTPVSSYSETGTGILLTAETLPRDDDGNYYPYYRITYYLRLKDGVDLETLAIQNGGEYDVINTAQWGGHETSYTYKTKYDYLDKQLLNEEQLGGSNRKAQYQITFNAEKSTIRDLETGKAPEFLTMTDVLSSNLSLDYSSIRIVTDPEGLAVPYSIRGGDQGQTVATYTVPNATKVTVTYSALIIGNGYQTFTNTVSVMDRDSTVERVKEFESGGQGQGNVASFKIVKVDGYDASKKLAGVKFKIFSADPTVAFDNQGTKEITLTTDQNGEIIFDGDQYDFYFDKLYYVQEIEGLEDYGLIGFNYQVTLTADMSLVDYGHYIYYFEDSMQIKNWPLEGLVVEKQVESDNNYDYERYYNFRISILKGDGSVNTDYNETNSGYTFVNGVVNFQLKAGQQVMFRGFAKNTKYRVEEIFEDEDGNEFTTTVTYSVYDESGKVIETITETTTSHTGTLTQEDEVIVFKNKKVSEHGALKLTKTVTVNGSAPSGTEADGDYTFTVTGPGADGTVSKQVVITVTNGAAASAKVDGTATGLTDGFVLIDKLEPGEYTITETGLPNGMSLSKINDQPVTGDSTKVTVVAGDTAAEAFATFTNNKDYGSLTITKTFAGDTDKITEADKAKIRFTVSGPQWSEAQTLSYADMPNGSYTYERIELGTYTVTETTGDGKSYTTTYRVGSDGTETTGITASATVGKDGITVAFTNTYTPGSATLQATKSFNDWGKAASFTFNLAAVTENAPMPASTTAVATEAAPTAVFGEIEYTKAGTYEYTITEVNDHVDGVTYDTTPHNVVVTVTKDDSNALTAVVKYDEADNLTITNTYAPATATLQATKSFSDWGKATSFTFNLAAVTENAPIPASMTAVATKMAPTAVFGAIEYTKAGTYEYTITEVNGHVDGVTYDTTPHTVIVTVTKDDSNALSAAVKYDGADSLTITNTFTPARATLQATKSFSDWGKATSFTFNLARVTANAPMPASTTADATEETPTAVFGVIEYTKAGEYKYTITEVNGHVDGVTYDTTPHDVVVTVTKDDTTNALSAAVKYDEADSLTITNTFTPVKATLQAKKSFNDWGKAESFTFNLAAVTENAPIPASMTAVATEATPTAVFGEIVYEVAGTYQYMITEVNDHVEGVTYDTTPHAVVVAVTKNNTTNELSAVVKYDGKDSLTITNTYAPATATLQATKSFSDWGKATSFTFNLAAVTENAPMPSSTTAVATEETPTAVFEAIEYTKAGTYEYTITEVNDHVDGVTYDTAAHAVVVTVTKNDTTNALTTAVKYDGADSLTITNTFTPATATLQATKSFNDWGKATSFTFSLARVTANAPMPSNTTAVATEEVPTAVFGAIEYTKAGEYKYTITEVNDHVEGVTYDTTAHSVVVTVTKDAMTNALTAAVKYDGKDSLTITNRYQTGSLKIKKTVTGKLGDRNKEFSFKIVLSAKGTFPYTVSNGTTGTIESGGLIWLKHGEYAVITDLPVGCKYQVTETNARGYRVYSSESTGVISAGTAATATAAFTNSKSDVPPTGENDYLKYSVGAMLFSGLGMIATFFSDRKRRKKEQKQK